MTSAPKAITGSAEGPSGKESTGSVGVASLQLSQDRRSTRCCGLQIKQEVTGRQTSSRRTINHSKPYEVGQLP